MLFSSPHSKLHAHAALACLLGVGVLVSEICPAAPPEDPPKDSRDRHAERPAEFFEKKIRPVLVDRCYGCHSEASGKAKGGFRLDSRDGIRRGGETGPAVVPGRPDASLLLRAIRREGPKMPPDGPLPDRVIRDFVQWIELGAPDPRTEDETRARGEAAASAAGRHWAFTSPRRSEPPSVADESWPSGPIDRFVLARLEAEGIAPSAAADPATLLRRVTFDLTGLPPSEDAIESFLADASPVAYEKVVDRLLSSVQFGERWARLWLDVARYAEDQAHIVGNNESLFYPNAYIYRDWVIAALSSDVPYDRFVRLQLAVDLLEPENDRDLPALGFIGLGPKYYDRNNPVVMGDEWEDRVDTVSRGILGLTVACARCHDHKYDPISTEDYYGLAGVFASTEMFNRPRGEKAERGKKGQAKSPSGALHIVREGKVRDLHVQVRGNPENKGPLVRRRFLSLFERDGEPRPFERGSGRAELAESVTKTSTALTARVIVNRVWGELTGAAIVATPSNFGVLGARPTHPELLDDLAIRFVESGWSLKWLCREIVLSSTYRQRSDVDPVRAARDEANRLLWRMHRRRLPIESWRDAILTVAGELDAAVGGKSVDPARPEEKRRTVYARVSRFQLNSMLQLFDFPDPNVHAAQRALTITPLQKLFALNSAFILHQAQRLADSLLAEFGGAASMVPETGVRRAYARVFGRAPSVRELAIGREFFATRSGDAAAWKEYVHALLVSNELVYLD